VIKQLCNLVYLALFSSSWSSNERSTLGAPRTLEESSGGNEAMKAVYAKKGALSSGPNVESKYRCGLVLVESSLMIFLHRRFDMRKAGLADVEA
jgi:hypothetical protein